MKTRSRRAPDFLNTWIRNLGRLFESKERESIIRILKVYEVESNAHGQNFAFLLCLADPVADMLSVGTSLRAVFIKAWAGVDSSKETLCPFCIGEGDPLPLAWDFLKEYFENYEKLPGLHQEQVWFLFSWFKTIEACERTAMEKFIGNILNREIRSIRGLRWAIEVILNGRRSSFLSGS